jgi:ubiquinone/menaquinone biosynthesis C-methylase UbiE
MALHPLALQFDSVADAYERGRPDYPLSAVRRIVAELGIAPGATVLDLAAGTGKLTRSLLNAGLDVIAVEPQQSLRALLAANVGSERVCDGLAEAIPLPDQSVAAVTVADAFHWFEPVGALREIRRVLRPAGGLAVVSTASDWGGASWAHEVGTLLAGVRPEHPQFDGPSWQDAVRAAGGWAAPFEIRLTTSQPAPAERVVDYVASISWVAALPREQRVEMLAEVSAIVAAGETPAELPLHILIGLTALA